MRGGPGQLATKPEFNGRLESAKVNLTTATTIYVGKKKEKKRNLAVSAVSSI